jgi:hypothetical protein
MGPHGGAGAGDQHVIGSRLALPRHDRSRQSSQPPFCTIASNGITDLSTRGEPHSHQRVAARCVGPPRSLEDQALCYRPAAGGCNAQKICAGLERYKPAVHRNSGGVDCCRIARSRRQAFAALCPPRSQHPAPAHRRHARAKAVTAFPNEVAGLVSPLHGSDSKSRHLSAEAAI